MDQGGNEIRLAYIDRAINEMLEKARSPIRYADVKKRFTQSEELFLALPDEFFVPHFPIHHDVRQEVPRADYIAGLGDLLRQLIAAVPEFFEGLSYFFEPTETLRPCFFRLYRIQEAIYLYLMRLNLLFKPNYGEVVERGSNDVTPVYRSKNLFLESELYPLEAVMSAMGRIHAFRIRQTISDTWIGEIGHGYTVRGIWMDSELTKFFSKVFLPDGKRTYPYYPFTCKYKTVCMSIPDATSDSRKKALPLLHRALEFLVPEMEEIQRSLKGQPFTENLAEFRALKSRVPGLWSEFLKDLSIRAYLNGDDLKEFELERSDPLA